MLIVVDVESDGPVPPIYSMVSFGAVVVEPGLSRTFYGETAPISEKWIPEALAISGIAREKHKTFKDPVTTMTEFKKWIDSLQIKGRPIFVSDNVAFDWQWINYYFHAYLGDNPFGFSGRRIGDIYSGCCRSLRAASDWKKMRKTKHTHHPVDDAKGNAEALLEIINKYKL